MAIYPEYEVICLVESEADEVDQLPSEPIQKPHTVGDSLVIAGGDGLFKIHIHCDDTAAVMDTCRGLGTIVDQQITRLSDHGRIA